MGWELASELVEVLRGQGKTDAEIIHKLCETTDRYKNYYKVGLTNNTTLKEKVFDLRVKHKELVRVEVEGMWISEWGHTYTYWKSNRYVYKGGCFVKDTGSNFDAYRMEHLTWKFKVWLEPIYYQRPLETTGEIVGTLHGKQLVEIEHVHGFNRGDKVFVRQEKDYEGF